MPRTPPLPPSPKTSIKLGKRTLKIGDKIRFSGTVTRIGEDTRITVQFAETGLKMTVPLQYLPEQE